MAVPHVVSWGISHGTKLQLEQFEGGDMHWCWELLGWLERIIAWETRPSYPQLPVIQPKALRTNFFPFSVVCPWGPPPPGHCDGDGAGCGLASSPTPRGPSIQWRILGSCLREGLLVIRGPAACAMLTWRWTTPFLIPTPQRRQSLIRVQFLI